MISVAADSVTGNGDWSTEPEMGGVIILSGIAHGASLQLDLLYAYAYSGPVADLSIRDRAHVDATFATSTELIGTKRSDDGSVAPIHLRKLPQ